MKNRYKKILRNSVLNSEVSEKRSYINTINPNISIKIGIKSIENDKISYFNKRFGNGIIYLDKKEVAYSIYTDKNNYKYLIFYDENCFKTKYYGVTLENKFEWLGRVIVYKALSKLEDINYYGWYSNDFEPTYYWSEVPYRFKSMTIENLIKEQEQWK